MIGPEPERRGVELGAVYTTANAGDFLPADEVLSALRRHACGDWGNVGEQDWQKNDEALRDGSRLFSVYKATNGSTFWIITEADRASTTVLLPDDY